MTDPDPEVFNAALAFAIEWGPSFGQPIDERLQQRFPHLAPQEIREYARMVDEAKYHSFRETERSYLGEEPEEPTLRSVYPFINDDNLAHLHTQGMYYAWKDHGDRR